MFACSVRAAPRVPHEVLGLYTRVGTDVGPHKLNYYARSLSSQLYQAALCQIDHPCIVLG